MILIAAPCHVDSHFVESRRATDNVQSFSTLFDVFRREKLAGFCSSSIESIRDVVSRGGTRAALFIATIRLKVRHVEQILAFGSLRFGRRLRQSYETNFLLILANLISKTRDHLCKRASRRRPAMSRD